MKRNNAYNAFPSSDYQIWLKVRWFGVKSKTPAVVSCRNSQKGLQNIWIMSVQIHDWLEEAHFFTNTVPENWNDHETKPETEPGLFVQCFVQIVFTYLSTSNAPDSQSLTSNAFLPPGKPYFVPLYFLKHGMLFCSQKTYLAVLGAYRYPESVYEMSGKRFM